MTLDGNFDCDEEEEEPGQGQIGGNYESTLRVLPPKLIFNLEAKPVKKQNLQAVGYATYTNQH